MVNLNGTKVIKDVLILNWADGTSTFELNGEFITVKTPQ